MAETFRATQVEENRQEYACGVRCNFGSGLRDGSAAPAELAGRPGQQSRPAGVAARFVVRLVACAMQVDESRMLTSQRGTAEIARARQIAMYLLHTSLSISYADVAAMFDRDRTTVSHACRTIEDLRDDPMHDDIVSRLEEMVELARSMSIAERRPSVCNAPRKVAQNLEALT